MLRRSFRIGLLLGLLGGAVAAAVKAIQGRSSSAPAPAEWTPIPDAQPVVVPPPAPPAPRPAASPPRRTEPAVRIADLQEAPAEKAPVEPKSPAKKAPAKKKAAKPAPWIEPVAGGCPDSHPIKGKLASKIFHLPGGFNYARTTPDRCYIDAAAAEADGLRQAKR